MSGMVSGRKMIWRNGKFRSEIKKTLAFAQRVQDAVDSGERLSVQVNKSVEALIIDSETNGTMVLARDDERRGLRRCRALETPHLEIIVKDSVYFLLHYEVDEVRFQSRRCRAGG